MTKRIQLEKNVVDTEAAHDAAKEASDVAKAYADDADDHASDVARADADDADDHAAITYDDWYEARINLRDYLKEKDK
tara:strand:+ start:268 stop:501 length:234 start_codon:yes stop_codon:yes gene_type:complete